MTTLSHIQLGPLLGLEVPYYYIMTMRNRSPRRTSVAAAAVATTVALSHPLALAAEPGDASDGSRPVIGETDKGESAEEETGFGVAPFAAATYAEETSLMFGAAAVLFYKHPEEAKRRESSAMVALGYSVRNQVTTLLSTDAYLLEDRLQLESMVSFARFPDSYFGIGNDTKLDDEERYTAILFEARALPRWRIFPHVYVGPAVRFFGVDMRETEPDGALGTGSPVCVAAPTGEGRHGHGVPGDACDVA
jgi:hypothetical protein